MNQISLGGIAGGALEEKAREAIMDVMRNLQDPNTPWKTARKVCIELKFTQNEERNDVVCAISVSRKLAQERTVATKFMVGTDLATGEVKAEEYGPGIKGQISIGEYRQMVQEEQAKPVDGPVNFRKQA